MCSCGGKKNVNLRKPITGQRGLVSNLSKSRQLPPTAMRQLAPQMSLLPQNTAKVAQENAKKIRQRSIREKFGHA